MIFGIFFKKAQYLILKILSINDLAQVSITKAFIINMFAIFC